MGILLALFCILCVILVFCCLCQERELRSLNGQLGEIAEGSHIELTAEGRGREMLALCRILNRILEEKDRNYIQYEKAEKLLKQNIAGLAHDIRTPLTGAMGYLQLARECAQEDRRARYLQAAETRLEELEEMLEEMFLYTKLAGGEIQLSMEQVQVLPVLSSCLLGLYAEFEEKGTEPEVSFESEGYRVYADEEALGRIFRNLIQNALIHGTGGISISQTGNRMIFENPAPQNSKLNIEQMFDKFYKSDPSRKKGSSGLGLFIVKELMLKMGGDAAAELQGNSLRIILYFPETV